MRFLKKYFPEGKAAHFSAARARASAPRRADAHAHQRSARGLFLAVVFVLFLKVVGGDELLGEVGHLDGAPRAVAALHLEAGLALIAGLPADSPEGFCRSLDRCLDYGTDNVTVHTLALKKGSRILTEGLRIPGAETVAEMLDYASPTLRTAGYRPYYLYRQKYMSGSFENIGWCRSGGECWYNVDIMSELCSILSFGAAGSTKMVVPGTNQIQRAFNVKYPTEYIQRPEKWQANQTAFAAFYEAL